MYGSVWCKEHDEGFTLHGSVSESVPGPLGCLHEKYCPKWEHAGLACFSALDYVHVKVYKSTEWEYRNVEMHEMDEDGYDF